MRLLSRVLAIVLVVCLIAIALAAVPVQAQCGGPFIELSPSSGVPETNVTVHGYDFAGDVLVDIYYDGNPIAIERTSSSGDFTVFLTVPEGGTGHYQVLAVGKYASVDTYFTVKPGLTVTPEQGLVGTTVTVKGQGFAKNEQGIELMYYRNDSYETIERNIVANGKGSWETSFQIPSSTRGEHKIDAEGAVSRLWKVQEAIFRVTAEISIDKSSGSVGDTITMTGSRFTAYEEGIKILLDGEAVVTDIKANFKGEWETSFQVPEMSAGIYSITAEGEQTSKEDVGELSFEIGVNIVVSPGEGHVGTDVTVTGIGFAAGEGVVITYDGSQVASVETNDKGSFEVGFAVPGSQYGERLVTARVSGGTNSTPGMGNSANAIFIMESAPPPIPALTSPADKIRVGLVNKVTLTFEWLEVFDDSGVRYNLQVATGSDFATSSVIASVTGLTETSYTLEETEALPYGTYYWMVQAVDGAENESDWSAAYSFRVGLLPRWGFIAIIAVAAMLLLLLIRALVIRRGIYYDRW